MKMTFSIIFANDVFSNFLLKSFYVNLPIFYTEQNQKQLPRGVLLK